MPMNNRLMRPRARGFNPRSISGLELYLNASVSSSITLNGSNVSEWRDLSGKGRHCSQETAANQPAFSSSNWLGRPCVEFTRSSNHTLAFTPFSLTTQTAFFAIEPTEGVPVNNRADILNNNTSTAGEGNVYAFANIANYKTYSVLLGSGVSANTDTVGSDLFAQARMLISHTYNNAGSTTQGNHGIRKNRSQETAASSGLFGAGVNVAAIGGRTGSALVALSARIALVLLYSRVLSSAEIAAIENWAVVEYPLA